jgi:hypothetical protein
MKATLNFSPRDFYAPFLAFFGENNCVKMSKRDVVITSYVTYRGHENRYFVVDGIGYDGDHLPTGNALSGWAAKRPAHRDYSGKKAVSLFGGEYAINPGSGNGRVTWNTISRGITVAYSKRSAYTRFVSRHSDGCLPAGVGKAWYKVDREIRQRHAFAARIWNELTPDSKIKKYDFLYVNNKRLIDVKCVSIASEQDSFGNTYNVWLAIWHDTQDTLENLVSEGIIVQSDEVSQDCKDAQKQAGEKHAAAYFEKYPEYVHLPALRQIDAEPHKQKHTKIVQFDNLETVSDMDVINFHNLQKRGL